MSKFYIVDNDLVIDDNYEYKNKFIIGYIVAYKTDTKKLGVVSFTEEDNLNINWNNNTIIYLWEELSNGKSEDSDLKCLYLGDLIISSLYLILYIFQ